MPATPKIQHEGWASAKHPASVYLILAVVGIAILFDGYDLVIYGAVLSNLLKDPTQIGALIIGSGATPEHRLLPVRCSRRRWRPVHRADSALPG